MLAAHRKSHLARPRGIPIADGVLVEVLAAAVSAEGEILLSSNRSFCADRALVLLQLSIVLKTLFEQAGVRAQKIFVNCVLAFALIEFDPNSPSTKASPITITARGAYTLPTRLVRTSCLHPVV